MSETIRDDAVATLVARASASEVFARLRDVAGWAQIHRPLAHAEYVAADEHGGLVRTWSVAEDETVDVDDIQWVFDEPGGRASFRAAPQLLGGSAGVILLDAASDAETRIVLRREDEDSAGNAVSPAPPAFSRLSGLLAAVKEAAERSGQLAQTVLSFEDEQFIAGDIHDAYEYLEQADLWPERIPHVLGLRLEEPKPGIQFFDMDTAGLNGSVVTTRSVRICLPDRLIVYKQTRPPALLDVHTGHWRFTQTPEGVIAGARHTVTIKPSALAILGEGATVLDARKYLRKLLSGNSTGNLRFAKAYAEGGKRG